MCDTSITTAKQALDRLDPGGNKTFTSPEPRQRTGPAGVKRSAGSAQPAAAGLSGELGPRAPGPGRSRWFKSRQGFCYLVARPLIFAGLFLNGECIPSRNVLDLEKQSAISLDLQLGLGWIFKQ